MERLITCELCGEKLRGGLASHQRGGRCEVGQVLREMSDRGLEPIPVTWEYVLGDMAFEKRPGEYHPGGPGSSSTVTLKLWVEPWIKVCIEVATVGPDAVGVDGLRGLLNQMKNNTEFRQAAETAYKLTGAPGLRRHLGLEP